MLDEIHYEHVFRFVNPNHGRSQFRQSKCVCKAVLGVSLFTEDNCGDGGFPVLVFDKLANDIMKWRFSGEDS